MVPSSLARWIPSHNHLNRLTQAPKHHLADPALAARLVGATRASLLRGAGVTFTPLDGTYLGQLFESLATLSVKVFATTLPASVSHLRLDSGRREVDLILERDSDRAVVAFGGTHSPARGTLAATRPPTSIARAPGITGLPCRAGSPWGGCAICVRLACA
jgi:hypothetical protein